MNVSRSDPGGEEYNDLRNKAQREKSSFQELLALHALDGFLARLAISPYRDQLILKGGVLLAAYDLRRTTRDVDLLAQELSNDAETVLDLVRAIAALPFADGLQFDTAKASATVIRDDDEYTGVRVSLTAHVATAVVPVHVDVNVGDPVSPAPQEINLPRVLGDPVRLLGYPMVMVHAEKIVTAVSRGTANTRWRDFGDVHSIAGRHAVDGTELMTSIKSVAEHRGVALAPLRDVLEGYAEIAQARYAAWRRNQGRDDLPEQFQDVLGRVFAFSEPALASSIAGKTWDPQLLTWI